jgi:hypothetical protein
MRQSEVHLVSGDTIRLGLGARGTFYEDHMVLEQGSANVSLHGEYQVWAKQLAVQPRSASTASIALLTTGNVAMAVYSGAMRVLGDSATSIDLPKGRTQEFAFAPQTSQSPHATAWGWQRKPSGRKWVGQGARIGWVAGTDLFLEPEASYQAAQELAGAERLPGEQTLRHGVRERGLLASM